ncbi:MAG: hypothetical protein GY778_30135 [bacterium]|nr:hypothetical protein [bacterium]
MQRHRPTGWNTWDFRGFNRLVHLARGQTHIVLSYAIWDEGHRPPEEVKNHGGLHRAFRWSDVTRLGPHAPLGLPAVVEFNAGDTAFRAEAVERDGGLELTVTPLKATRQRVAFLFLAPVGETVRHRRSGEAHFAGLRVDLEQASWPTDYFLNVAEPYAIGRPGLPATIRVGCPARPASDPRPVREVVEAYTDDALCGAGALADAPEAMVSAVTWNTLYDARRQLVSSPVSRDWCVDWKGVSVWCWDTVFVGGLISHESPELGRLNFEAVTAAIDELGMVPNYYMAHGAASRDRSMPCLGSYLIWKVQQPNPDRAWLERIYRRLRRWHRFWFAHRDGNGDGLLEWGSDADPRFEFPQLLQDNPQLQHSAKCAMYESGLDNSPMYDDVPFNDRAGTLELADVGLNSYYAMDCEALARIADVLDKPKQAAAYRREYETMRARVNESLWDDDHGIFCNRHWDGRFSLRWSPTSFLPLVAGLAPRDRAERMVHEHLLNEREFWGQYVIPSIARSDPAYPDNDYWRGRIWGPFNYLVGEGLRRYRFDDQAADLARRGLEMFLRNWREQGGVYENYNADTGAGGDVWNAARLYHWGGLLALTAIQELIDSEPTGWLRFGSVAFPASAVRNVRLGGAVYDVELNEGLRVRRNGRPYLACTTRAIVRIPLGAAADRRIEITAAGSGRLTLVGDDRAELHARVNGAQRVEPEVGGEEAAYTW